MQREYPALVPASRGIWARFSVPRRDLSWELSVSSRPFRPYTRRVPKWGLSQAMIEAEPWRISQDSELLEPSKVITDPVHGDIYLNRLELAIIDSRPLQRLRRVRQLGMTSMVYPGATNTRFSHSLGALRAAQDLLDIVFDQRHEPHGVPDLFGEWDEELGVDSDTFARRRGEVTVLARLGALLHDLGHVPFGHSVEDDLGILVAHDKNRGRFDFLWDQLVEDLERKLSASDFKHLGTLVRPQGELKRNLRPLILSNEEKNGKQIEAHEVIEYPFVADIVGNTICADLVDYLARDHLYTGLPMALGHRFMSAFFVTRSERTRLARRMALGIERNNRERTDVITELLKYLRYRYELTERVLIHHAKLSADAMVGKALELWFSEVEANWMAELGPGEGAQDEIPTTLQDAEDDSAHIRTQKCIERRILAHGDDGLLEHLRDWLDQHRADPPPNTDLTRTAAISGLIDGLLRRDLFLLAGRSSTQQASARTIYKQHGGAQKRRELEEDAARFAGIDEAWKIAIWLPPPDPRLKSADVLVFDGSEVVEFSRLEQYAAKRGEDIYGAHGKLWGVSVYMHRSIEEPTRRQALARLAQRMEVRWDREAEQLGSQVLDWPDRLAVIDVCKEKGLPHREDDLLKLAREERVARGPDEVDNYEALVTVYRALAKDLPTT
jgi:HD superfamily phosphohydrolase